MTDILAMAVDAYGPVAALHPVRLAVAATRPDEVRVRVVASAVNPADFKVILGQMKLLHGRRFPLVVGYDFSGVVEAKGTEVTGLDVGQEVFGFLPYSGSNHQGAFAEALNAKASEVAIKPKSLSHEQAAALATPASTALQSLRDLGRLQAGQRVVVTGASGGVGSLAIATALRLGAEVTAVGSGEGLKLAEALGAQRVIDRRQGDLFAALGGPFHVVFDAAAAYRWRDFRRYLHRGGTFVTTLPSVPWLMDKVASLFSTTLTSVIMVKSRRPDLEQIAAWAEAGMVATVDRVVPLQDVAQGIGAVERGEVVGRVVIRVANG